MQDDAYRQHLEELGEEVVRHRLGNRMAIGDRAENNPPYEFTRGWLAEKASLRDKAERRRYLIVLIVAVISAIAAVIAAAPVVKSWVSPMERHNP
jgi:hypothetical protein